MNTGVYDSTTETNSGAPDISSGRRTGFWSDFWAVCAHRRRKTRSPALSLSLTFSKEDPIAFSEQLCLLKIRTTTILPHLSFLGLHLLSQPIQPKVQLSSPANLLQVPPVSTGIRAGYRDWSLQHHTASQAANGWQSPE